MPGSPRRVKSAVSTPCQPLPVYPSERTSSDHPGMSQRCQKRASGPKSGPATRTDAVVSPPETPERGPLLLVPCLVRILDRLLPDENAQARQYRNGAARPGLQHETGDAHSGRWRIDEGDPHLRRVAQADRRACLAISVRVFTQSGSKTEVLAPQSDVSFGSNSGH